MVGYGKQEDMGGGKGWVQWSGAGYGRVKG